MFVACLFASLTCIVYVIYPTDPKTKLQISKAAPAKKKTALGKNETERKRVGKKASAAAHANKRPGDVVHTSLFEIIVFFIANIGTVNQRFAMYPLCSSSAEDHLTLTDLCRLKKTAMCPWRAAAPCCRCCHRIRSEAGRDLCDTSGVCSAAQLSSR